MPEIARTGQPAGGGGNNQEHIEKGARNDRESS